MMRAAVVMRVVVTTAVVGARAAAPIPHRCLVLTAFPGHSYIPLFEHVESKNPGMFAPTGRPAPEHSREDAGVGEGCCARVGVRTACS